MKLAHLNLDGRPQMVWVADDVYIPAARVAEAEGSTLPSTIDSLILDLPAHEDKVRSLYSKFVAGSYREWAQPFPNAEALPPVLRPTTLRDAYAFRQHVETSRMNRGLPMIPAFDEFPVFYFSNPHALVGAGPLSFMPLHYEQLDYELEVAVVLGRGGRNLKAATAHEHIFGFMVMNDWSARALQMAEMQLNLGPAKGKDFATGIGPLLVTTDELEPYRTAAKPGHTGAAWRLHMQLELNGEVLSQGYLSDMDWTYGEILERISYGVDLYPTDIVGSGTVGTGCLLELNGTGKRADPNYVPRWLQPGDSVTASAEVLGQLQNTIEPPQEY